MSERNPTGRSTRGRFADLAPCPVHGIGKLDDTLVQVVTAQLRCSAVPVGPCRREHPLPPPVRAAPGYFRRIAFDPSRFSLTG